MRSRFDMSWMRCGLIVLFVTVFALAGVATAGQQTQASIIGQATDESHAVLPGVTVTAKSPALQVPEVTGLTDERGEYRLAPLPIGLYQVEYTLPGFQPVRQENVRLTVGFVARLDVVLKIGALDETITVSGESPVVDVSSTTTMTLLSSETIELIPTARNGLVSILAQAPGVRVTFDVGGNQINTRPASILFAQPGEPWYALEGLSTTSLTLDGGAGSYWDYATVEESQVATVGGDAEKMARGVQLNAVVKSGGVQFHGGGSWGYTSEKLQSDNIDEELSGQGIRSGDRILYRFDLGGDLGGRLVTNKLWFYAAARRRGEENAGIGSLLPDGTRATGTETAYWHTEKLSYQLSRSHKLVGFYQRNNKHGIEPGSEFTAPESRGESTRPTHMGKIEWQGLVGSSMVMSLQHGTFWNYSTSISPSIWIVGTQDIFTQRVAGEGQHSRPHNGRNHGKGSLSWYKPNWLSGNHEFKVGFDYMANSHSRRRLAGRSHNYSLAFNNGVAFQMVAYNAPSYGWVATNYLGVYAKDSWTVGRRLTLNLGVRYAHDDGFVPERCVPAADPPGDIAFPGGCYDRGQMAIWNTVAPRLHAAYDLTGNGRTVIKGGWARFDHMRQLDPEVLGIDPNVMNAATYRWRDLNDNRNYDPGEVDLDPNGPDFVSRADDRSQNAVANPNEKQPKTDELSISFEHQLRANFAVRLTGVNSRSMNDYRLQNNKRPYETYNVPVTRPDPGAPGTFVTYYEFPRTLAGKQFEEFMLVNDPRANRSYKSFEVAAFRRLGNGWQFMASYSATKKNVPIHRGLGPFDSLPQVIAGPSNPNAEINQADRNWDWQSKISGLYIFPADVMVSANFEHRSGNPFGRQVLFTGGATIPSIVLNVEPIGTRRLPNLNLLDIRVEKPFRLSGSHKLTARVNLYNLLNFNTVTALNMRSGATFLRPSAIVPPRILELSASYAF